MNKKLLGNLLAILTVIVWGSTYLVSKNLMNVFDPLEIMLYRFIIATIALFLMYPKPYLFKSLKEELILAAAGLTGVSLYQLGEYMALKYTSANNVSIITSTVPFITALFVFFILKKEPISKKFLIGFGISIIGVCLVTFNGIFELDFNPLGNLFAFMAIIMWGFYSVCVKVASDFPHNPIQITRRIMTYGFIFTFPIYLISGYRFNLEPLKDYTVSLSLLYLGIVASGFCFTTWNFAVKHVGAVLSSVYLYLLPVVTIIFSFIFLKDKITLMGAIGTVIVLIGLFASTSYKKKEILEKNE